MVCGRCRANRSKVTIGPTPDRLESLSRFTHIGNRRSGGRGPRSREPDHENRVASAQMLAISPIKIWRRLRPRGARAKEPS